MKHMLAEDSGEITPFFLLLKKLAQILVYIYTNKGKEQSTILQS